MRFGDATPHQRDGDAEEAARTPNRPNPLGAAVLTNTAIADNVLTVPGLYCLYGTPWIDIKPAMGGE